MASAKQVCPEAVTPGQSASSPVRKATMPQHDCVSPRAAPHSHALGTYRVLPSEFPPSCGQWRDLNCVNWPCLDDVSRTREYSIPQFTTRNPSRGPPFPRNLFLPHDRERWSEPREKNKWIRPNPISCTLRCTFLPASTHTTWPRRAAMGSAALPHEPVSTSPGRGFFLSMSES